MGRSREVAAAGWQPADSSRRKNAPVAVISYRLRRVAGPLLHFGSRRWIVNCRTLPVYT